MANSLEIFHTRISERLSERGAVAEFVRKTGIARSLVDRWVNGIGAPALDSLEKIAQGLDMEPWDLIKPPGDLPPTALEIIRILGRLNEDQLRALLGTAKLFAHVNGIEQGGSLTQKQKSGG